MVRRWTGYDRYDGKQALELLKRLYTALSLVAPAEVKIDWSNAYAARFKAAMRS